MEVERVGARQARNHFADLVGNVHYGGQVVIVERSGKPMVAVIPVEMYERLVAEREARFAVLDRIRSRLPDIILLLASWFISYLANLAHHLRRG